MRELEAEKTSAHDRLHDVKRRTRQFEAEVALSAQTQEALHRETRTLHKSFEQLRESNKTMDEEVAHLQEQLEKETREAVRVEQEAEALAAEQEGEKVQRQPGAPDGHRGPNNHNPSGTGADGQAQGPAEADAGGAEAAERACPMPRGLTAGHWP